MAWVVLIGLTAEVVLLAGAFVLGRAARPAVVLPSLMAEAEMQRRLADAPERAGQPRLPLGPAWDSPPPDPAEGEGQ